MKEGSKTPAVSRRSSAAEGEASIYATPLRSKAFYKDTGNITKLEVFLQGGVGSKKRKKKARPETGKASSKEPKETS